MRPTLGFGLAVLLVVAAGVSADDKFDAAKLVGKWELREPPQGVKAVVEFAKDGKLQFNFTFDGKTDKVDGTYKLDGDTLTADLKDKKLTNTVTKLTDEELVVKDEKGKEESYRRLKEKK